MSVFWVVERDVFSERCFNDMIATFKKYDIPYQIVTIIPFIHEIEGKKPVIPEGSKVVVYGSIGSQKLALANGWNPGVWTSSKFSETEIELPDEYLLNPDFKIFRLSEVWSDFLVRKQDHFEFFIKPNTDSKEFAGTVMNRSEFQKWHQNMVDIGYLDNSDFDVVVCSPKNVTEEYRFVVVNGMISSSCMYKNYGRAYMKDETSPEASGLVNDVIKLYNPADVYVVDVGLTSDGFKVIEYNTFNSAGLYLCDVEQIILDINEFVENENKT